MDDPYREAVELAQRLDMRYDVLWCPAYRGSGNKVLAVGGFSIADALAGLRAGRYDVAVLAARPTHTVIDALLAGWRRGMGLVFIEPVGRHIPRDEAAWNKLARLMPSPSTQPPRPVPIKPPPAIAQRVTSIAAQEGSGGRRVRLQWASPVRGLLPSEVGSISRRDYEAFFCLLATAVRWAAGRRPPVRLSTQVDGRRLHIRYSPPLGHAAVVEIRWASDTGWSDRTRFRVCPPAAGMTVSIPRQLYAARGTHSAFVLLRTLRGQALGAAVAGVVGRPRATIAALKLAADVLSPGDTPTIDVTLAGRIDATAVRVAVTDAYGRLVARTTLPAQRQVRVRLQPWQPLCVYHTVAAELLADGVTIDRRTAELFVPAAGQQTAHDFHFGAGYTAMHWATPDYLIPAAARLLRSYGISFITVDERLVRCGFPGFGGTTGGVGYYRGSSTVRSPCMNDPVHFARCKQRVLERVSRRRRWGWLGYNTEDEVHLHQTSGAEVCTCPHCTEKFRHWLRQQYGTLEHLSRSWGAQFHSWQDVRPLTLKSLRGDNLAPWVDWRLFMEQTWYAAYRAVRDAVRQRFPEVLLGFTNPYHWDSLSGSNIELACRDEPLLLKYPRAFNVARHRSWSTAPRLAWVGYGTSAAGIERTLWWLALEGAGIPIWWDPLEPWAYSGKRGIVAWYMIDPLWRPTPAAVAARRAASVLNRGVGKLLISARPGCDVAVLHSQPSLHVCYALAARAAGRLTTAGFDRWRRADETVQSWLKADGFGYRFIHLTDMPAGKAIVLPHCLALPEQWARKLRDFAERGGIVIADMLPGQYDEHGHPRPGADPFARLFGVAPAGPVWQRTAAAPVRDGGLGVAGSLRAAPLQRLRVHGARVLATAAGQPLVTLNSAGRGAFVLVNAAGDTDCLVRLLRATATAAGLEPPLHVHSSAPADVYRLLFGEIKIVAVLPREGEPGKVAVRLSEPAWVVDVLRSRALGYRASVRCQASQQRPALLAVHPSRPQPLAARLSRYALPPGEHLRLTLTAPRPWLCHIEVVAPDSSRPLWAQVNLAGRGTKHWPLPLPLNAALGRWRIEVHELLAAHRLTLPFTVLAPTGTPPRTKPAAPPHP